MKQHFSLEGKVSFLDVLKESYGQDEVTRTVMARFITKAAAIPADTTTSGWADTLVQTVIADMIQALLPRAVYPALAEAGDSFTFGRNGVVSVPARNTSATLNGSFVLQGTAIPVRQGALLPITFTPKKMAVISVVTREIMNHSTPAIEGIIKKAILEDTAVALDTVLLDAVAASATRPAGLKAGVTKITASVTASIVGFAADIKALATALIAGSKGNMRYPVWIMNPGDVLTAALLPAAATGDYFFQQQLSAGVLMGYPIIQSTTCAADTMILLDAADFISLAGEEPNFSISDQGVVHMEDTAPAGITTGGSTPAFASPVRSFFQTDCLGIRMILDINFGMRRTGTVAWADTLAWN